MDSITHFLEESIFEAQTAQIVPLQLHLPHSYETLDFEALIHPKMNVVFRELRTTKIYSLMGTVKMEPKYDLNDPNHPKIEEIKMHSNSHEMLLRTVDHVSLQRIYETLKLSLSHKGFADYFKAIKRLGKGAFATVYLVQHRINRQQYAAKVFSREGQKLEFKGHQALQSEIRTLRFTSHPNIIQYEGIYETDNLIYLVTEFLSGGTLKDFIQKKSSLDCEKVTQIISDILQALSYLKKNHIMHRDLKPQNILLRPADQKWVLVDFGLAAFTNEKYLFDRCGTLGYMAPEVFTLNEEEKDAQATYHSACDVYSLGVISFQLIFGSLPFKFESQGGSDKKVVWYGFKKAQCAQINSEIAIFVQGLLETDPLRRTTACKALQSTFFTDQSIVSSCKAFILNRLNARNDKILQLADL